MYDNNMTSNEHISHVFFQLFTISLFSLAYFVKHFDGEIVLAPRSSSRCNSHMFFYIKILIFNFHGINPNPRTLIFSKKLQEDQEAPTSLGEREYT